MKLYEFDGKTPKVADKAYIQDGVKIVGDVVIEDYVSVWFNSTIRGDLTPITIKKHSNIQELTTIHSDAPFDVIIGENVTIGHNCVIHGAVIGNNVLVGMGSTLLNGCRIGDDCLIGAGSLITQNAEFESGMLIMGRPAKAIRPLKTEELELIKENASEYSKLAQKYKKGSE